jgi:internalin A
VKALPTVIFLASLITACDAPEAGSATTAAPAETTIERAPTATATAKPAVKKKSAADCSDDATVTFDEPSLEAAIRKQLKKPAGPVTKAELAKVDTLDLAQGPPTTQLDPCIYPHLTGLTGLYLAPGTLDDIAVLAKLDKLESLRIAATRVKDVSPLAGLTKLDRLDLGRTPVTDLTPLTKLVNLTNLMLDETEVTDLAPLAKVTKLTIINIKRTRVSDVSPLKGLPKLANLYIEGSAVQDTSALDGLKGLHIHRGK